MDGDGIWLRCWDKQLGRGSTEGQLDIRVTQDRKREEHVAVTRYQLIFIQYLFKNGILLHDLKLLKDQNLVDVGEKRGWWGLHEVPRYPSRPL